MRFSRAIAVASLVAFVTAVLGATTAAAKPDFVAYASCGTKPAAHAKHCGFDRPKHARATVVFQSNVGKRTLKVCQKISGLSFHGRQCLKTKHPIAREVIPFELKGAYKAFKLVVTFYVRGASGSFEPAGRVALKFSP